MEPGKVTVKAMCVIVRNGNEVLAALGSDPFKGESFGRLIGGGIEFGETAEVAIHREFLEELNAKIKNLAFLRVVENIFAYREKQGHQIIFLYKGDFVDKELYKREEMDMLDKPGVKVTWVPLNDVKNGKIKLYPIFDYEKLL